MEWLERMNAVIDYLEDNLSGDIDIMQAADIACCSTYHLQRVFLAVYGISVAEYVRRRRLSCSASDLLTGDFRVIDIAMKYGYNSPDSFSRAFRNLHGVTPQAAREPGVQLVAFPRLRFHITLTGGDTMDYKVVDKPAFEVIVRSEKYNTEIYENYTIHPEVWDGFWWQTWEEFYREKRDETLKELVAGKTGPVTGSAYLAVITIDEGTGDFSYGTGIENTNGEIPEGYRVVKIPAATWAVFTSKGPVPKEIHDLGDRIFREWFPSIGYEHDSAPELEVYLPGDRNSADYLCEVWMPVVKK
ncbi:MAG: GyrI-like domain-containing protein [Dehalococcoidales bacterium]|nr:GyrI-like domain-containing protein [Dehalococcoidales bacterium]